MESRKRMGKKKKKGKAKHEKKILSDFRQQHQNSSGLLNSSSLMSSLTPFYNGENFELSQLLRRLDKKDATTRAKNLDRLCEIANTCKPKDAREMLSHWMYVLDKLWMDNDRRVRTNAFKIMLTLTKRVPKALRKRSKAFLTPWLCSMFDPCRDVSKLAERSFHLLHEDSVDLMTFLKQEDEETIGWILEDLEKYLRSSKSDLSDLKLVSVHEAEIRFSRVLMTSFRTLRRVMSVMFTTGASNIVVSKLKWKVWSCLKSGSKYDSAVTRAAHSTFQLILSKGKESVISKWFESDMSRLKRYTDLVVASSLFAEKSRENHTIMCNSMLMFLKQFPSCWSSVSYETVLLPRVWSFLRHGCYGSDLYDSMFVFRSMVPKSIEDKDEFVMNWFESFWEGIPDNVNTSRFESALSTLCRCVQVSFSRMLKSSSSSSEPSSSTSSLL